MMKDFYKVVGLLCLCLLTLNTYGQSKVSGVVKDAVTGETIPGATVIVKGTNAGTITNLDGKYTISVMEDTDVVVFSFIGYKSTEITVGGKSVIDMSLEADITELSEVVVIGYGTQKKKVVTGSIASVSAKDITSTPVLRVEQALQGRTAGVQVTSLSGQPGEGLSVTIRGAGTAENSDPLYVVDGMVVGGIDYLNPGDIESLDVLKDAASCAIYGARGGNGVVLITTKSGKAGQMNVTYSGYYGVQNAAKKIDMLNAEEYMMMQNEGARNGGLDEPFDLNEIPAHDTNWQDEMFTQNAPMSNHEIQIMGGTEKSSFSATLSAFSQQGIIGGEKSQFDRYTARFNGRHQVTDWFRFGNNFAYAKKYKRQIDSNTSFNGAYSSALNMDPLTPVTETNSDILAQAPYSTQPVIYAENGYPYGISNYVSAEIVNPLALLDNQNEKEQEDKLVGGVFAEVEPIKGLVFKTNYSIDLAYVITNNFTPLYYLNGSQGNLERTNVSAEMKRWFNWQWENTVTYSKKINEHNFSALLGTSAKEDRYDNVGASNDKVEIIDEDNVYIDQAQDTTQGAWGEAWEHAVYSYFARVTYDYKERYSATLIWRRDYSSNFGENNKYGDFPSIGLAWIVSDEGFMQNSGPLNLMKIRASVGLNGNESIPRFRYASPIATNRGYTFGGGYVVGASPEYSANPDIEWESSLQSNAAIDLGLFQNKLTASVDFYNKTTVGLLYNPDIPSHVGNAAPFTNVGSIRNRGIEIALNYRGAIGELSYSVGGNATYNQNTFIEINGNPDAAISEGSWSVAGNISRSTVGDPISYFYGYKTDGIFQSELEVFQHIGPEGQQLQANAVPGDVRFVDVNNDGVINDDDRTQIGVPTPDWTYGFNGSMSYSGFDFSFLITGVLGNDIFAGQQRRDLRYTNLPSSSLDRWTVENPSSTTPRFTWVDTNTNNRVSDLYIEDGSYLRLKNIQLGYTIPSNLLEKVGAKTWRVYVSAENLVTLTNYSGADPEVGATSPFDVGIDSGVYPQARTFRFGTSVTF